MGNVVPSEGAFTLTACRWGRISSGSFQCHGSSKSNLSVLCTGQIIQERDPFLLEWVALVFQRVASSSGPPHVAGPGEEARAEALRMSRSRHAQCRPSRLLRPARALKAGEGPCVSFPLDDPCGWAGTPPPAALHSWGTGLRRRPAVSPVQTDRCLGPRG